MLKQVLMLTLLLGSLSTFAKSAFIQVTADANVEALPDFINVSVSIEKRGNNSAQAKADTDAVSAALNTLLRRENIQEQDIDQARLSIYPNYQWDKGQRFLQGYTASRSVTIKLRDLNNYNLFMSKLSELDLQRVVASTGGFDNESFLEESALVKALGLAKTKAEAMATALNADLGKVLMIQEGRASVIQPRMYAEMASDSQAEDQSVSGELKIKPQKVSASVTVQFELK